MTLPSSPALWKVQLQALIVNLLSQAYAALGDKNGTVKQWARHLVIDGLDACQGLNIRKV